MILHAGVLIASGKGADHLIQGAALLVRRLLAALLLIAMATGYTSFGSAERRSPSDLTGVEAAIVFTGADERIEAGLELLATGAVRRLYISGANANAGVSVARFQRQFGSHIPNMDALLRCCVEFGEDADTTLQNAVETQCWLEQRALRGPVALVTSALHMPRARAALSHFVNVKIVPYPIPDNSGDGEASPHGKAREIMKYLATLLIIHLPSAMAPKNAYGVFKKGCSSFTERPGT